MRTLAFLLPFAALSSACIDARLVGDGLADDGACGEVPCDDPCGEAPCGDEGSNVGDGAIGGPPTPFALNTASAIRIDDVLQLSFTDDVGLTACGLAEDENLVPGVAATQIFVKVESDSILSCPEGVYPLYQCESGGRIDVGCARYRSWNERGQLVARTGSVGGALRVTRNDAWDCLYEVEVAFPGGSQIRGSFILDNLDVWEEDAVCTR